MYLSADNIRACKSMIVVRTGYVARMGVIGNTLFSKGGNYVTL